MSEERQAVIERRGVRIVDTFAEAFGMRAARIIITAQTAAWAHTAAQSLTGFATSVIGCKVEAGIEAELSAEETPDFRPGISVLLFGFDADGLTRQLIDRIGQTVLTCPTTACFDGLPEAAERVIVGGALRHFGDKFQASKVIGGQRFWRIPVMEGEFLVQEAFGVQKAIGGGNLLLLARDQQAALVGQIDRRRRRAGEGHSGAVVVVHRLAQRSKICGHWPQRVIEAVKDVLTGNRAESEEPVELEMTAGSLIM